jgi:spore maturation protein CgeB
VPQSALTATPFLHKVTNWRQRPDLAPVADSRIAQRAHSPVFGVEMFQQLHETRVALNSHIDISPVSASNIRLFEATGVASCLLTDDKSNLATLFEPDAEVVAYSSAEDCAEKARYLLDHPSERRAIAEAGQRRTLRDHTFAQRVAQLDEIIGSSI